jgi:hypothetical protein
MGDWKAVAPIKEPWELYDLSTDREESVDLAVIHRDKLEELKSQWQRMMDDFRKTASEGIPEKQLNKPDQRAGSKMGKAQEMARPKSQQVLLGGERFLLADRHTFLMRPDTPAKSEKGKPWIFYGPTLPRTPDKAESWMHERFLDAGIAVAGIDVGEMYGSPLAFPFFDALYDEMVKRGYSKTPALLGRSRGDREPRARRRDWRHLPGLRLHDLSGNPAGRSVLWHNGRRFGEASGRAESDSTSFRPRRSQDPGFHHPRDG